MKKLILIFCFCCCVEQLYARAGMGQFYSSSTKSYSSSSFLNKSYSSSNSTTSVKFHNTTPKSPASYVYFGINQKTTTYSNLKISASSPKTTNFSYTSESISKYTNYSNPSHPFNNPIYWYLILHPSPKEKKISKDSWENDEEIECLLLYYVEKDFNNQYTTHIDRIEIEQDYIYIVSENKSYKGVYEKNTNKTTLQR